MCRFERWRIKHHLTVEAVARKTGYTLRQVYNWRLGKVPHEHSRPGIAEALGCKVSDLFDLRMIAARRRARGE